MRLMAYIHYLSAAAALWLCASAVAAQNLPADSSAAPVADAAALSQGVAAHPARVVTNAQMLTIGSTNLLDTYLSPEKYRGTALGYTSLTERRREGARWAYTLAYHGDVAYASNRADNANDLAGMFRFAYGLHRHWTLCSGRLELTAGGLAGLNLGFVYNTRNGNNPAQARFSLDLSPAASAAWHFRVGRTPVRAVWDVSAPLAGLMFSPAYGQSYYEIFSRGNYDHNIVPTTFVCAPSFHQMLALDITLGRSALRIGYTGDVSQAKVNSLKYHTYTHSLTIGLVRRFTISRLRP